MSASTFTGMATERPARPGPPAVVAALVDALRFESRLLVDLVAIMRRQRDAVAHDDLDALDDSVFSTHRVLVTLGEARRRRRSINRLLGESDDLSVAALDLLFAGQVPDDIRVAADLLAEVAHTLQAEVDVNRRVLRIAIESGDQLVRSLAGVPVAGQLGYSGAAAQTDNGVILDRRV